jgi:hypothetical protein
MTTEQMKKAEEYVNKVCEAIATDPDIKQYVQKVEGGIKTTKGNYGKYMQFLTPYAKEKLFLLGVSNGLKKAGADSYGVNWAVKILTGAEV